MRIDARCAKCGKRLRVNAVVAETDGGALLVVCSKCDSGTETTNSEPEKESDSIVEETAKRFKGRRRPRPDKEDS